MLSKSSLILLAVTFSNAALSETIPQFSVTGCNTVNTISGDGTCEQICSDYVQIKENASNENEFNVIVFTDKDCKTATSTPSYTLSCDAANSVTFDNYVISCPTASTSESSSTDASSTESSSTESSSTEASSTAASTTASTTAASTTASTTAASTTTPSTTAASTTAASTTAASTTAASTTSAASTTGASTTGTPKPDNNSSSATSTIASGILIMAGMLFAFL
ncbi:hypothetical protein ACTFIV_010727 [Dictyostelium citrinum]